MPFDYHYEQDPAFAATANPADTPAIDSIAACYWFEQAQELGFNFHATHA